MWSQSYLIITGNKVISCIPWLTFSYIAKQPEMDRPETKGLEEPMWRYPDRQRRRKHLEDFVVEVHRIFCVAGLIECCTIRYFQDFYDQFNEKNRRLLKFCIMILKRDNFDNFDDFYKRRCNMCRFNPLIFILVCIFRFNNFFVWRHA